MEVARTLLRFFSFLFHGLLALFLITVSGLALASGIRDLHFGFLPGSGLAVIYALLLGGVFGLSSLYLAIRGRVPLLFFLWNAAVAAVLLKGYIFSGYRFVPGEAARAFYLVGAAVVATLGAWPVRSRDREMRRWDRY